MRAPDLNDDGFTIHRDVLPSVLRETLAAAFAVVGERAGTRTGLDHAAVRALAVHPAVRALVEPVLGQAAFAFRATLFDKTAAANWLVAWHQDRVVPVRERRNVPGFDRWSRKQGVWFVEPPVEVLQRLLAVRIDLDGSGAANGGLRVLPGSHRHGVLAPSRVAALARDIPVVTCEVPASSALCLRPLLLHASSRAPSPRHRRIVHLEFAAGLLPGGLDFVTDLHPATAWEQPRPSLVGGGQTVRSP